MQNERRPGQKLTLKEQSALNTLQMCILAAASRDIATCDILEMLAELSLQNCRPDVTRVIREAVAKIKGTTPLSLRPRDEVQNQAGKIDHMICDGEGEGPYHQDILGAISSTLKWVLDGHDETPETYALRQIAMRLDWQRETEEGGAGGES